MNEKQRRAYLYGLVSVGLWSTVASAFKISLRYMEPVQLLLYAHVTSIVVLGTILACTGRLCTIWNRPARLYGLSLIQGFLNPFLYYTILFAAYDLLPAQVAQPLNYTWAITLSVLSVPLLGQKITLSEMICGMISYTGVAVITSGGTWAHWCEYDPLGVVLALLSTVVWSFSWIANAKDPREPTESLFLSFLLGLPFSLITCIAFAGCFPQDPLGIMGAVYVGIFEMGVTFVFWLRALRTSANASRVANLIYLSPLISLILIHFVVGERIKPSTLAGLVLIIVGLVLHSRIRN